MEQHPVKIDKPAWNNMLFSKEYIYHYILPPESFILQIT